MSKFSCQCGNVISDVGYPSPHIGDLTSQQDAELLERETTEAVRRFLTATRSGSREGWIRSFFLSKDYPTDLSDESIISDMLLVMKSKYARSVLECDQCGRLWIQVKPEVNDYKSYSPDELPLCLDP